MALVIQESLVDATKEVRFSELGWCESYTDDLTRLYRGLRKEYGRCTSKVYIDRTDGTVKQIGWVFVKRCEYDDARATWPKEQRSYLREAWISLGWRENDDSGVKVMDLKDLRKRINQAD